MTSPDTNPDAGQNPPASSIGDWLSFAQCEEKNRYGMTFQNQHIGNPIIRSVHGGVTAAMIEMSVEHTVREQLAEEGSGDSDIQLVSSSINYLRVTKDVDLQTRTHIVRLSRRLAFVDVWCWQDDENTPIARATCTVRILRPENSDA